MPLGPMEHRCDYCGCYGPGTEVEALENPYRPERKFKLFMCIGCQEKYNYHKKKGV